jgi:DNA (cytosine-5)-methyltransferase 1
MCNSQLDHTCRQNELTLLDLYCGEGGAAMGYYRAGFTKVVGVDIKPQPRYPFGFVQADAVSMCQCLAEHFDVIHASPPCQHYSRMTKKKYRRNHKDLIAATRAVLQASGKPYVIENVPGARRHLISPLLLCGTMFGLPLWRHRLFEIAPRIAPPIAACDHRARPVPVSNSSVQKIATKAEASAAMQIDWMSRLGLGEAIPPAYTEYIAGELILQLKKESLTTAHNTVMQQGVSPTLETSA